jgi:hypothetical protein
MGKLGHETEPQLRPFEQGTQEIIERHLACRPQCISAVTPGPRRNVDRDQNSDRFTDYMNRRTSPGQTMIRSELARTG